MEKRIRNGFLLAVGIILFLPVLLTLNLGWIDFSETGQIGDTIGGVMGPFVGLVGAWLVYLSFQQQIEANRIQRDALANQRLSTEQNNNFTTVKTLISELKGDYNQLEIGEKRGKEAINYYVSRLKRDQDRKLLDNSFVLEYRYILESVLYIERSIVSMELSDDQRHILQYSLAFFVDNKLNHQAQRTIENISSFIPDTQQRIKFRIYNSAVAIRAIDWHRYL